jgi:ssDNA-binding Zn-finger/Zn-ribbon topoisomerase 1
MPKKSDTEENPYEGLCPKCGSELGDVVTTKSGKKLQRCSQNHWNPDTKAAEGCDYVKWFETPPKTLKEKCPKCGAPLMEATTRAGKKFKKCSTSGWDREARQPTGCDYVEWDNGSRVPLDEECPKCGQKLVFVTTANGKKMKKCSTSGWDRDAKQATGCTYVEWMNDDDEPSRAPKKKKASPKEESYGAGDEEYPDFDI